MAQTPPSITQIDVTRHRFQVQTAAVSAAASPAVIAAEARRLGGRLTNVVRRQPVVPPQRLQYGSERRLLGYAASATDFFVLELPKHMRAYDRRSAGVTLPVASVSGFQLVRMARRRSSGHITGALAEAMCVWALDALNIAPSRNIRRISQVVPALVGNVCPDFLIRRQQSWLPGEAKHVVDARFLRRPVNRGFAQVLAAMASLGVSAGYLFVAIDGPASGSRYRAEVVELYV